MSSRRRSKIKPFPEARYSSADFAMSDFSLTLVMRLTTSKIINNVAKVQIKSEKITPFGGIFHV